MTNASIATILPEEARHFGAMAAEWWDPKGSSAMLHKLNPVRLAFLREMVDAHWGLDTRARQPLTGKRVLDVGCGAGLLAEPLARLGAAVTAIDAAPENIAVARDHAERQGLAIDYRSGELAALSDSAAAYDLVTCMEVVEHVADAGAFVTALAALVAPGGLLLLSTPNRTALSRFALITLGEGTGRIPEGTHDWTRFLTPPELEALFADTALVVVGRRGIVWSITQGFALSDDETLNYLFALAFRPA